MTNDEEMHYLAYTGSMERYVSGYLACLKSQGLIVNSTEPRRWKLDELDKFLKFDRDFFAIDNGNIGRFFYQTRDSFKDLNGTEIQLLTRSLILKTDERTKQAINGLRDLGNVKENLDIIVVI